MHLISITGLTTQQITCIAPVTSLTYYTTLGRQAPSGPSAHI